VSALPSSRARRDRVEPGEHGRRAPSAARQRPSRVGETSCARSSARSASCVAGSRLRSGGAARRAGGCQGSGSAPGRTPPTWTSRSRGPGRDRSAGSMLKDSRKDVQITRICTVAGPPEPGAQVAPNEPSGARLRVLQRVLEGFVLFFLAPIAWGWERRGAGRRSGWPNRRAPQGRESAHEPGGWCADLATCFSEWW
jgi:hypothetical protein